MDLMMRLEQEAVLAGGRVHQLLGNHEVMNLIGDLRYVSDAEYAAFAADESAEEREYWYQQFRGAGSSGADEFVVRAKFDSKAPPGYFGHRRAFRRDGAYGTWLLEKPFMVVINDTAFVHGGVPPLVLEYGLAGVNVGLRNDLREYVTTSTALVDSGALSPIDEFRQVPAKLHEKVESGELAEETAGLAQWAITLSKSALHGPTGPTWYRGSASCNRLIEGDGLNAALSAIGARRVVMGHTTTFTRRVQQRLNGRVIKIDTGMLKASYNGSGNALVIEGDAMTVVNQNGETNLSPIVLPRRVGYESKSIDDDALASLLSNGTIYASETTQAAWRLVQVKAGDRAVFAYFNALPREKGFVPELAAYRLDRMLGLDMVPVTVSRVIEGQLGALQFVPAPALSERERVSGGQGDGPQCSLAKQRSAMHVFDALIHNPVRTPLSMLYSPDNWQLTLVNHENAFGTDLGKPDYLENIELAIGDEWRSALIRINDAELRKNLGDVLDKRRLKALARRRDALIEGSIR